MATALAPEDVREWMVAGYLAPSARLALRWLTCQACHLADRIDPPLDAPGVPVGVMWAREVHERLDAATFLRTWAAQARNEGSDEHEQALDAMREGALYRVTAPADDGLIYSLSTRTLVLPIDGCTLQPPTRDARPLPVTAHGSPVHGTFRAGGGSRTLRAPPRTSCTRPQPTGEGKTTP
ncbi:hypothetical protein [Streptomyces lasiicapitis]|uniref:hypothetical protein n=1 Tax=Streptomyces lasiicapitis TaxID=1923961 RepID=UPI003686436A